jgi:polyisoprenoid-binding protein YceI
MWLRNVGIAVGAVAVLAVAGPFIYIHFISGDAPPPLTLPPASAAQGASTATTAAKAGSATSATAGLDGTWNVVDGSQAGYRVKEILFGQDHDAVGRTSSVSGTMVLNGSVVQSSTITVDMTSIKSDESRRDSQFHGRIMSTSTFPTATFTLSQPITVAKVPAEGAETTVEANGQLTLRGTTKPVTAQLTARRTGDMIAVSGSIPIKFADWNIPNPSTAGISTQDNGVVEFLVNFARTS